MNDHDGVNPADLVLGPPGLGLCPGAVVLVHDDGGVWNEDQQCQEIDVKAVGDFIGVVVDGPWEQEGEPNIGGWLIGLRDGQRTMEWSREIPAWTSIRLVLNDPRGFAAGLRALAVALGLDPRGGVLLRFAPRVQAWSVQMPAGAAMLWPTPECAEDAVGDVFPADAEGYMVLPDSIDDIPHDRPDLALRLALETLAAASTVKKAQKKGTQP